MSNVFQKGGSTRIEVFQGASPVTGLAPTQSGDGMNLTGFRAVTVAVQAPPGSGLTGGSLLCYVKDPALAPFPATSLIYSASYAGTAAFLVLNAGADNSPFKVGMTVTGSNGAQGTVVSAQTGSANSGWSTAQLSGWNSASFSSGSVCRGTKPTWARFPAYDMPVVSGSYDTLVFSPLVMQTPRPGCAATWVPSAVAFQPSGTLDVRVVLMGDNFQDYLSRSGEDTEK